MVFKSLSRHIAGGFRRREQTVSDAQPNYALTPEEDQFHRAKSAERAELSRTNRIASSSNSNQAVSIALANAREAEPRPTRSGGGTSSSQGLSILYTPDDGDHAADIIFVHGLGGTSHGTWCSNRDVSTYWPQQWLPKDVDLRHSRIFTFGYDAKYGDEHQGDTIGISAFSDNLLFDFLCGRDDHGRPFRFGRVPIIFVAHSMGGLLVKYAYLQLRKKYDHQLTNIYKMIRSMVFLATPHRGAGVASLVNMQLSLKTRTSTKQYVSELETGAPFLENLNKEFEMVAADLNIYSFHETLRTTFAGVGKMIVQPESATLGYPSEIARPLKADHFHICKFKSPRDPNYLAILEALKHLMSACSEQAAKASSQTIDNIRRMLSISPSFNQDFMFHHFRKLRADGTCSWLLDQPAINSWLASTTKSGVLFLHGRPGCGKSVMAAFLAQHLRQRGHPTQHIFFRVENRFNQNLGVLLRDLAVQIAEQVPRFRQAINELAESAYKPQDDEYRSVWRAFFAGILFQIEAIKRPIYWIIDGINEASQPQLLFDLLTDVKNSRIPIRIILVGRWSKTLSFGLKKLANRIPSVEFALDQETRDIENYVNRELRNPYWQPRVLEKVRRDVLGRAQYNFLWTRTVVDKLKHCGPQDDPELALSDLPREMVYIYDRMTETFIGHGPRDADLCRQFLIWTMYAHGRLTTDEMADILMPRFGETLNFAYAVNGLCDDFIAIEPDGKMLMHHTACCYLSTPPGLSSMTLDSTESDQDPFGQPDSHSGSLLSNRLVLDPSESHADLFDQCLRFFLDPGLRSKLQHGSARLYSYRAISWPGHLSASGVRDGGTQQLELLSRFLSEQAMLVWIYILASTGQIKVLIQASSAIRLFVQNKRQQNGTSTTPNNVNNDLSRVEQWSRDLLKILSNFGRCLTEVPSAAFTNLATFSPTSSSIYHAFNEESIKDMCVRGLPPAWGDLLVSLSNGKESAATQLSCCSRYLGTSNSAGMINVWDCEDFRKIMTMEHHEAIWAICFSASENYIASYGLETTKIWDIQTGQLLSAIQNPHDTRALCMDFVENDTALVVGSSRNALMKVLTSGSRPRTWRLLHSGVMQNEPDYLAGTHLNSPSQILFSPDRRKVAVVHKSYPTTIWSIDTGRVLKRVSRQQRPGQGTKATSFIMNVSWHPYGDELLGIFMDGACFKLNLVNGSYREMRPFDSQMPSEILCNPSGLVYAVRTVSGSVRLFDYQTTTLISQFHLGELVMGACFSHDGRRFYDIRGSCCDVWEQDVLTRISTAESSEIHRQLIGTDLQHQASLPPPPPSSPPGLAMAPSPQGVYTLIGDEEGNVDIFNLGNSQKTRVGQTPTQLCIEHTAWSEDGLRFCYTELHGRVTVMEIEERRSQLKIRLVDRFKVKFSQEDILDVTWLPGSKSLLLSSPSQAQIWALQPARMDMQISMGPSNLHRKWTWIPQSRLLLSSSASNVSVHLLGGLQQATSCTWQQPSSQREIGDPVDLSTLSETVGAIIRTGLIGHVLIRIARGTSSRRLHPSFHILDAANLSNRSTPLQVPRSVRDAVGMPLDVLPNERLIFIDRSSWVCSWPVRSPKGAEDIERHFFIPRNWLPIESLELLRMTSEGSILVPRDGGVSLIKTTLCSMW